MSSFTLSSLRGFAFRLSFLSRALSALIGSDTLCGYTCSFENLAASGRVAAIVASRSESLGFDEATLPLGKTETRAGKKQVFLRYFI
jgi:hypothetical protein